MRIDLEQALAEVAGTVHDDVTADRMSGQVRHMVTRIRRRRAVRHTATGVTGVGAAAAIAVAGVQLGGRGAEPVTPGETTPSGAFGTCGSAVPTDGLPESATSIELHADDALESGALTPASVVVTTDREVATTDREVARDLVVALVQEGRVVSPLAAYTGSGVGDMANGDPTRYHTMFDVQAVSCDDDAPLAPGGYELWAVQPLADGQQLVASVPITVRPADGSEPGLTAEPTAAPTAPDDASTAQPSRGDREAQRQMDQWLGDPVDPQGRFPVCGSVAAEVLDDGMPVLELDLLDVPTQLASGAATSVEPGVALHTTEGRYAIGNTSPAAGLVLLSDGIVVGAQWLDPEDAPTFDLADGDRQELPLLGSAVLCGTGEGGEGPALPLPPGEYQAMAVLEVTVKEVGGPGQEPDGRTFPMTVVSEPRTLTVTAP